MKNKIVMMSYRRISILTNTTSEKYYHCMLQYYQADKLCRMGGEKRPGIDCLRMPDHSQKNLGICLRLEIVGKINTHTSDILPYH